MEWEIVSFRHKISKQWNEIFVPFHSVLFYSIPFRFIPPISFKLSKQSPKVHAKKFKIKLREMITCALKAQVKIPKIDIMHRKLCQFIFHKIEI